MRALIVEDVIAPEFAGNGGWNPGAARGLLNKTVDSTDTGIQGKFRVVSEEIPVGAQLNFETGDNGGMPVDSSFGQI